MEPYDTYADYLSEAYGATAADAAAFGESEAAAEEAAYYEAVVAGEVEFFAPVEAPRSWDEEDGYLPF